MSASDDIKKQWGWDKPVSKGVGTPSTSAGATDRAREGVGLGARQERTVEASGSEGIPLSAAQRAEATRKELRQAIPQMVKDGLGLRGKQAERAARVMRTFVRRETRLPTITELKSFGVEVSEPEPWVKPGGLGEVSTQPFQLIYFKDGESHRIKVKYSTLAGDVPTAPSPNDEKDYEFAFTADNIIYGKVTINGTTGEVTARTLHSGNSLPVNTGTTFHVEIGKMFTVGSGNSMVRDVVNSRYGPIDAAICRKWYAAEEPYFGLSFGLQGSITDYGDYW